MHIKVIPLLKNKKTLIPIGVCVVVAIIGILLFFPSLTTEEGYVLQVAKDIQKELLAPHTMNVIQAKITLIEDGASVAIHYSAMNRGGGYTDYLEYAHIKKDGQIEYGTNPDSPSSNRPNSIKTDLKYFSIAHNLIVGELIDVEKVNAALK